MIISRLMGGLGNQMFQYAVGRQLAIIHNTAHLLDISDYRVYHKRSYMLGHLNIREQLASPEDLNYLKQYGLRVKEQFFHYDQSILKSPDNTYLDGYWQSYRYFAGIADILRSEFTPRQPLTGRNAELAHIIQSCEAVSVHVRRGDYIDDQTVHAFHGLCGLDYYQNCALEISRHIAKPHFFIFSDDPCWVANHLKISYPTTVVANNGPEQACEDLRLMAMCRYHIIANSTFGWWAAWLNNSPGKIVLAPARWFTDPSINTIDLFPAEWKTMGQSSNRGFKLRMHNGVIMPSDGAYSNSAARPANSSGPKITVGSSSCTVKVR